MGRVLARVWALRPVKVINVPDYHGIMEYKSTWQRFDYLGPMLEPESDVDPSLPDRSIVGHHWRVAYYKATYRG
jgi:hypothetical protein